MKTGKCPNCGKVPFDIKVQAIELNGGFNRSSYPGVMYVCPNNECQTILGAGVDFVAQERGIVESLMARIKKGK